MNINTFLVVVAIFIAVWIITNVLHRVLPEEARCESNKQEDREPLYRGWGGSVHESEWEGWTTYNYGKVLLHPPNGEPIVYDFPVPDDETDIGFQSLMGVLLKEPSELYIRKWQRQSSGELQTDFSVATSLPFSISITDSRTKHWVICRGCKGKKDVDEKIHGKVYALGEIYKCDRCIAEGRST